MKKNSSNQPDLEIYRTTYKDFDTLSDISMICFPNQLRWKAPKSFSRQWWDILINSEFCEIWTCSSEGKVIAYVSLILDRLKYEQAWESFRPGFWSKLYIFTRRPDVIIAKFIKQLRRYFMKYSGRNGDLLDHNYEDLQEKMKRLFAQRVSWLGPTAVIPTMQSRGIATRISQFCADRAAELGYKEMWGYLLQNNIKSRGLVKKLGFVAVEEIGHLLFIKKTLDSGETRNEYITK